MATETPNFQSILDEAPTEVKRPPPLPVGTYLCIVGAPEYGESSKKKTPQVMFPLRPVQPCEDVDEVALAEVGGLENKSLKVTYYLTEAAAFMLDDFHQHCGLDLSEANKRVTRNDMIVNSEVLAVVKHTNPNDNGQVYAEVARTIPNA